MEVDVAVLGAGPAGAVSALLLARRGLNVALIDKDDFPRDKVCGEFLSYDGVEVLQRLGIGNRLDEAGATHIRHCRLFSGDTSASFELPAVARGLSRFAFDDLLVREAAIAGVTVRARRAAESVERANGNFIVRFQGDEPLHARIIIGAWGRWGRIDRQLGRSFVEDHSTRHFGFKRHYRSRGDAESIDLYSFRNGYLGVSNVEGDAVNICGLVHEKRLTGMKGRWEGFTAALREESRALQTLFDAHEPIGTFLSSDPVIFRAKEAAAEGMFLVGDAAGMIDPLTGSGMSMALQSALLAAAHVPEALARSHDVERRYARAYRETFAPRLRWSRMLAALLERPGLLERLLRVTPLSTLGPALVRRTRGASRDVDRLMRNVAAVRF